MRELVRIADRLAGEGADATLRERAARAEAERLSAALEGNERELAELRRGGYLAQLRAAESSLATGDFETAQAMLTSGAEDSRRFEWGHLAARLESAWDSVRIVPARASALAVDRDGRWLAVGSIDGSVRLTELAHFAESGASELGELRLESPVGPVTALAFSPDVPGSSAARASTRLAVGGETGEIVLFEVPSGAIAGTWSAHDETVTDLAFVARGASLASASTDTTIRLWASPSGEPRGVLEGHTDVVNALAVDPEGRRLLSGRRRRDRARLGRRERKRSSTPSRGTRIGVVAVAWSPDGRLASASGRSHGALVGRGHRRRRAGLARPHGRRHGIGLLARWRGSMERWKRRNAAALAWKTRRAYRAFRRLACRSSKTWSWPPSETRSACCFLPATNGFTCFRPRS